LLQSGCDKIDDKIDRNYEAIVYSNKEDKKWITLWTQFLTHWQLVT
jgi:hypothetical protein